MSKSVPKPVTETPVDLQGCLLQDRARLLRRWQRLQRKPAQGVQAERAREDWRRDALSSAAVVAQRSALPLHIEYPAELPISEQVDKIAAALHAHNVIILAGETGSGKTTQIPKICLQRGLGIHGRIGHTQPRRIAARSIAARLAQELRTEVGQGVGFQVRFQDHVQPASRIKLMTDGILLNEIQHDPLLLQYDAIILDEAHERSLNIDFLLGYFKQLLPRRPDLKLIITSATIATEKFSHHFDGAPVIEVSGRTYPVEVRYRPLQDEDGERDAVQAVLEAMDELSRLGGGDVLVFLPGERQIRDTAEALRKHHPPDTDILPLFARLSVAEQNRVFQPHGRRRIVLATNVAETSLTVPGIHYVVDTGTARISRYHYRSKIQRLPIEKVSRAAADQRKGRCGRVAAGVCIRLYSEEDYLERPSYTDAEILRTNLASVILAMRVLGLGEIEDFPFLDAPDRRFINDGYRLLFELGAVDEQRKLLPMGKAIARLPLDPRLARMVLQARERACLHEVLVIAAALAIQDPRERPADAQEKARQAQAVFVHEESDFLSLWNLWQAYHEQGRHLSKTKLRGWCQAHYLAARRMQEWHDLYQQVVSLLKEQGSMPNAAPAEYAAIHQALLSGLLSHIGTRVDEQEYQGSHDKRFLIFPGSDLRKKKPRWIMAAEMIETTRLFAHRAARIEPDWVEPLAPHLVKREYLNPHWQPDRGQVAATEKVSLYGLVLIAGRKVNFGRIDPAQCRQIFIREALVQEALQSRAAFFAHNQALLENVRRHEDKTRRRDICVDEEWLYTFYDERLPAHIHSRPALERWLQKAPAQTLFLREENLYRAGAQLAPERAFPDTQAVRELRLALEYHFEPGDERDGVTVVLPVAALNQVQAQDFEWLVPGLLQEKIQQLIKSLPKALRRNFVPAPEFARACADALAPEQGSLLPALAAELRRMTGVAVPPEAWQLATLAPHLHVRYRVVDPRGRSLAQGRDLEALQRQLQGTAQAHFARAVQQADTSALPEREDVGDWDAGELPEVVDIERQGLSIRAYPALCIEENRVALRYRDDAQQAELDTRSAQVSLFERRCRADLNYLRKNLPHWQQICLHYAAIGPCEELQQDLLQRVIVQVLELDSGAARSAAEFARRVETGRGQLVAAANALCAQLRVILQEQHTILKQLRRNLPAAWLSAAQDITGQLAYLFPERFLQQVPAAQLAQYSRYLEAIRKRLEKLGNNPARDAALQRELSPFWERFTQRCAPAQLSGLSRMPAWQTYRWMLEEYRVSLFAQELKTAYPVSAKRLQEQAKMLEK